MLNQQMYQRSRPKFLNEAYEMETEIPYNPLLIDLTTSLKDKRFQVRGDILNHEHNRIYLPK
jgi:hypothetical protein